MDRRFLLVGLTCVVGACAAKGTAPPVAAAQMAPSAGFEAAQPESEETRCLKAAQLREDGYNALSALKLSAARRAYLRSLEYDPDNHGALVQLQVIDALANPNNGAQATDASNDHVYNRVSHSPCEKYAAGKLAADRPAPGEVSSPAAEQNGQVISYAKGVTAKPSDLLSPQEIADVVRNALGDIGRCYKRGVDRQPSLRGELVLHLDVAPSGSVLEVQLRDNTLYEQDVETCIANLAGRLSFPRRRSSATMSVLYPLMFGSIDDERMAAVASANKAHAAAR